jgi:hypothetical protein
MKASAIVLFTVTLATTGAVYAQTTPQVPYPARAFTPAHADLLRSAGVPAQLANAAYVEALARIVYYWGYAAVDQFGRRGMWELSANQPGQRNFACESTARNKFYPPGVTAEMLAADPNVARPAWVVPTKFWEDLKKVLAGNPTVGAGDSAMADQARALVALHDSSPVWKALLDRASLTAKAALRDSGLYTQVGVDSGNGWQR